MVSHISLVQSHSVRKINLDTENTCFSLSTTHILNQWWNTTEQKSPQLNITSMNSEIFIELLLLLVHAENKWKKVLPKESFLTIGQILMSYSACWMTWYVDYSYLQSQWAKWTQKLAELTIWVFILGRKTRHKRNSAHPLLFCLEI